MKSSRGTEQTWGAVWAPAGQGVCTWFDSLRTLPGTCTNTWRCSQLLTAVSLCTQA